MFGERKQISKNRNICKDSVYIIELQMQTVMEEVRMVSRVIITGRFVICFYEPRCTEYVIE